MYLKVHPSTEVEILILILIFSPLFCPLGSPETAA